MTTSMPSRVREAERAFLRKAGWLFPVLGALASLAFGGPFWAWVDGQPVVLHWGSLWSGRALAGALAFGAVPAAWAWGLRIRPKRWMVMLATAGILIGAEGLLQRPGMQAALWLAARARLAPDQVFMREVCYVRLEEAAGRRPEAPAVVLVGSSQVLNGVDERLLGDWLHPTPVIRRAMFGMSPLKAMAMRSWMPFRPGDVCVQYLSEFDFTNQEAFPFSWFRPYASWRTVPDVLGSLSWGIRIRHWREVMDTLTAATTEWWRARDFIRRIVFRFQAGPPEPAAPAAPVGPAAAAAQARGELVFADAEWAAFRRLADQLKAGGVALVVFEGEVNPALDSEPRRRAREAVRKRLQDFLSDGYGRYVSREEQALGLGPEDWRDMTHLSRSGRGKLTRRMARELAPD
jgi:hypothetical protein